MMQNNEILGKILEELTENAKRISIDELEKFADAILGAKRVFVAGAGRSLGYVNAPGLFQRVCAMCADMTADISIYETNRNLLYNGLRELGFEVVKPDGTFYIFPKTLEKDDIAFCERAKQYDILIVPGTGFGCPGHTRISYCVPTERIERSLEAFKKLADSYK